MEKAVGQEADAKKGPGVASGRGQVTEGCPPLSGGRYSVPLIVTIVKADLAADAAELRTVHHCRKICERH